MQKSIPCLKNQSQYATFLKTLMLLTLLQLQVSSKILINPIENDDIYKFDFESNSYIKTEEKLNFLKGYWTLITNGILEFAPVEPTFLMFSTTDNSQFIYLEKDVRVLSFKIHPDEFWVNVGPSNKKTVREPKKSYTNFTEFYDPHKNKQSDIDRNMRFLLQMMNLKKPTEEDINSLQKRLAKINQIPYYGLPTYKGPYSNQIGFFLEDKGDSLISWAKETKLLQGNWEEMIGDENHDIFKRNFVAGLMMALYFQDNSLLAINRNFDENMKIDIRVQQMLLLESVLPKAQEIINASEGLEEAFGKIIKYLSIMGGRIVEFFYSQKRYPFFNDLFRPRNDQIKFPTASVTLDLILTKRSQWRKQPMDEYTNNSTNIVYETFKLSQSAIEEDLGDLEEEAKQAFLVIAETLFDSLAAVVPGLGNINHEEQPQFMEFFKNEKYYAFIKSDKFAIEIVNVIQKINSKPLETEFDPSQKETILKSLAEYNFKFFAKEMLQMFYIPFSMEEFENRVIRKMSDFPPINNMGINFNVEENKDSVDVLQDMLYVVGILDYMPVQYFRKSTRYVSRDILTWEDEKKDKEKDTNNERLLLV